MIMELVNMHHLMNDTDSERAKSTSNKSSECHSAIRTSHID